MRQWKAWANGFASRAWAIERVGDGFRYRKPDGTEVTDAHTLDRIAKLGIPPAWNDVWICPSPQGHLQATGRDARCHRYHVRWRAVRDETKYHRMLAFGEALPQIRERVAADLRQPGLPRAKVLAAFQGGSLFTYVASADATNAAPPNEPHEATVLALLRDLEDAA